MTASIPSLLAADRAIVVPLMELAPKHAHQTALAARLPSCATLEGAVDGGCVTRSSFYLALLAGLLAVCGAAPVSRAADAAPSQPCVEVKIGQDKAGLLDCLNEQLAILHNASNRSSRRRLRREFAAAATRHLQRERREGEAGQRIRPFGPAATSASLIVTAGASIAIHSYGNSFRRQSVITVQ